MLVKIIVLVVFLVLVEGEINEQHSAVEEISQTIDIAPLSETNATVSDNGTLLNTTEVSNVTAKYAYCLPYEGSYVVETVNDTKLIKFLLPDGNVTSKETPAKCIVVLFYSPSCQFSSLAAPHFNALPRAFPDIKMVAINAMRYHFFNTQNGIVGVPSVLLFHNGKVVAKFNESDYTLDLFSRFITKNTGIKPLEHSFVTSADFRGPVTSNADQYTDMCLVLAWSFIGLCAIYYFMKSRWWVWIVDTVQSNWRESEAQAQHEHTD